MVQGAGALALQRRRLAAKSLSVRRRVDGLLSTLRDPVGPDFFAGRINGHVQVSLVLGFWAGLSTLDALLDKYSDGGLDDIESLAVLKVQPISDLGSMMVCLANAGNFMAWLSLAEESPLTRMTPYEYPYVITDGQTVLATKWSDLVDGALAGAITLDETGEPNNSDRAWTLSHPRPGGEPRTRGDLYRPSEHSSPPH